SIDCWLVDKKPPARWDATNNILPSGRRGGQCGDAAVYGLAAGLIESGRVTCTTKAICCWAGPTVVAPNTMRWPKGAVSSLLMSISLSSWAISRIEIERIGDDLRSPYWPLIRT